MPPSVNTQLREALNEIYENSKSIVKLSQEMKSLVNTLEPMLRLFNGSDHKESIETRIRLLEEQIKNAEHVTMLPECQKQIDSLMSQLQLFKHINDNFGNEINKVLKCMDENTGIINDVKVDLDIEKRKMAGKEELDREKRVNIRDVLMELLKWVLTIAAAVIIVKLTGQLV
jgi:predicted  nucleic acid-binding Zn-ribbon protein